MQDKDELEQEENIDNDSEVVNESEPPRGNPISNFIKDPLTAIKGGFDKFFSRKKRRFSFSFIKLWKAIPLKVKLILVIVILVIVIIVSIIKAIEDNSTKEAVTTRNDAVKKLDISTQTDPSALSNLDKTALELYDNYDSLIALTTDQLNSLYNEFLANDSNDNKFLLENGKREFGDENGDKFSYNYKRTLYEHILRTEKYNFNKIIWKGFTHTTDNVDLEKENRDNLELVVPKGIDDDTLATLFKTTAPYLLTQDIPLGVLCGTLAQSNSSSAIDASTAQKFTYQIIKESLTKLTMHRYELDTIKYNTTYDDYTYNTYTQVYYVNQYSNGYEELVSEETPVLESSGENVITPETKISGTEQHSYDIYWYPSEAITYDAKIKNNFNYTKYSDSDVQNIKNPDSNTLISQTTIDELSQVITPKSVNQSVSRPVDDKGNPEAPTASGVRKEYKYVKKEGVTYTYEKTWSDKLVPQSTDYEKFDTDTAKEYNISNNDNYSNYETDKVLITEQEFSEKDTSIFDRYTEEDTSVKLYGMSIIDLLDSNAGVYNKYLNKGGNVSDFEGIGRVKLKAAYNQIKNTLNSLAEKIANNGDISDYNFNTNGQTTDKTLPFVYGSSLGYVVTDLSYKSSVTTSSISGMDLLKEYIRSFEGSGKQPIQTNSEGVECYVAYRDSGGDLTVGYGVNLDGNPGNKKDLENQIGQTIDVGTLVPVEMVDAIEEEKIKGYYDTVKAKTNGLDLKEYQLHALTSLEYNNIKVDKIVNYYNDPNYWNEETDDKYETVYEKYKDNETAVGQIEAEADMTRGLYTNWLALNVHDQKGNRLPGLERRRRSEYILFSLGYYNTLQTFYTSGDVAPSGDVLVSNGQFDEAACLNLQTWFEANIFAGKLQGASSNLRAWKSVPAGSSSNFNSTAYGKYATGSSYAQCPWWSRIRANMYLEQNGHELITSPTTGHGYQSAQKTASDLNINCYSGDQMDQLRANAIISYGAVSGNQYGHVAYVEAVTDTEYIISHCGSGKSWHGLLILPKTKNPGIRGIGQVVGFCNLDEAI